MTVARDVRAPPPAGTLTTAERVRLMTVMKLRMMRNGLRRSAARTIGFVLGALWATGAAGVASFGLIGLRWQDAGLAADATTAAFAALTVGWTLLPLLICVLLARVLASAFSRVLRSRRFRDFATALLAVLMGSLGLGINIAVGSMSGRATDAAELRRQLHHVAVVAGDSPFGWAWSVPGFVAERHWATAGLHLVLALALVTTLGWAWEKLLARNLTSPADLGGSGTRVGAAAGLVDRRLSRQPRRCRRRPLSAVLASRPPLSVLARRDGGRADALHRRSDGRPERLAFGGRVRAAVDRVPGGGDAPLVAVADHRRHDRCGDVRGHRRGLAGECTPAPSSQWPSTAR